MKAQPERRFLQAVRLAGCEVRPMGSGEPGIFYKGELVCTFAVWHKKGSKREVGQLYINRFEKRIQEVRERERRSEEEKKKSDASQEQIDD